MKPLVRKRAGIWEVTFRGNSKYEFSKVAVSTWGQAIEAALCSGHKPPVEAAFGEWYLNALKSILKEEEEDGNEQL